MNTRAFCAASQTCRDADTHTIDMHSCIHAYAYMHTQTHTTHTCILIHVHMRVQKHARMHACAHARMHARTHTCRQACAHTCLPARVFVYSSAHKRMPVLRSSTNYTTTKPTRTPTHKNTNNKTSANMFSRSVRCGADAAFPVLFRRRCVARRRVNMVGVNMVLAEHHQINTCLL